MAATAAEIDRIILEIAISSLHSFDVKDYKLKQVPVNLWGSDFVSN